MDALNKSGIYKITNIVNNKIYIGSAVNILQRWYRHRTHANNNYHHSITFQRSWVLHGKDSFKIEVLEYCDKNQLAEREQYWLDLLQPFNPYIGYNICKNSLTKIGMKRSEQARENMRQAQLGVIHTEEHNEKIGIAHRDFEKWPCFKGSNCKCEKCKKQRTTLAREKRWAKEDERPVIIKKIKWSCPTGIKCKCDRCRKLRNDDQRNYLKRKRGY